MASSPTVPARPREPKPVVYPCQLVVLVDPDTDAAVRAIVARRRGRREPNDSIAAVLREMIVEGVAADTRKHARAARGRAYAAGRPGAAA